MPTRVVILGGGVAGMSAAHELSERGFEVVVLERRWSPGGKARSVHVAPGSGHELAQQIKHKPTIGHNLPGEHGFRFFPGFYKHVVDTMRRIPSFDGRPVADHLVPTTRMAVTQYGKPTFVVPMVFPHTPSDAAVLLRGYCDEIGRSFGEVVRTHGPDCRIFDTDAECRAWCESEGGGHLWERQPTDQYLAENLVGTVEQVAEKTQAFVDAGCGGLILWLRDYPADETLRRFITEVVPKLSV